MQRQLFFAMALAAVVTFILPSNASAQQCPAVKERIDNGNKPGEWTKKSAVCKGKTHTYKMNVGCMGPGLPKCGACTVTGELKGKAGKLTVSVHDENGKKKLSSGPKRASAPVKFGGTFSVRVHNAGPRSNYELAVKYICR